jgi:hypothetical protein
MSTLLDVAASNGDIERVRWLIRKGAKHLEVSETGAVDAADHFLVNVVRKGHFDILNDLLCYGASFDVDVNSTDVTVQNNFSNPGLNLWQPLKKIKAFYESFNFSFIQAENISIFRCVVLAMRSWRYKVGIQAMREDKLLSKIAGKFIVFKPCSLISKLFLAYVIVPSFRVGDVLTATIASVINGARDNLKYYRTQGLLDYKGFCTEDGSTLADLALS